jgi:phosphomannomutase
MLNYSVIGRDCTQEERIQYYEWDKVSKEREQIANHINLVYPQIEACIGGQISLDIQPKGYNKSLASKWIRNKYQGEIIFFGDRTFRGGNDYDICYDIESNLDGKYYQIDNQEELKSILSKI